MEPYVYSQMIAGKAARRHGEAKNSWLTGTAAWNFIAVSQWILGVRPDFDGLRIEPCLPPAFSRVEITRVFRGCTYRIRVENSAGGKTAESEGSRGAGTFRLTVDGKRHASTVVPPGAPGAEISVLVEA